MDLGKLVSLIMRKKYKCFYCHDRTSIQARLEHLDKINIHSHRSILYLFETADVEKYELHMIDLVDWKHDFVKCKNNFAKQFTG